MTWVIKGVTSVSPQTHEPDPLIGSTPWFVTAHRSLWLRQCGSLPWHAGCLSGQRPDTYLPRPDGACARPHTVTRAAHSVVPSPSRRPFDTRYTKRTQFSAPHNGQCGRRFTRNGRVFRADRTPGHCSNPLTFTHA